MFVNYDLHIFPDPEALAETAALRLAQAIHQSEAPFHLALSGGQTPIPFYRALLHRQIEWSKVHFWWSDERCVAPDDRESNFNTAAVELLNHLPLDPARQIHRLAGEDPPAEAARAYQQSLRSLAVHFDWVLLGLGNDGHTASLFPGQEALWQDSEQDCLALQHPQSQQWRLSLTPHLINQAQEVLVVVSGSEKAAILAQVLQAASPRLPIHAIQPHQHPLRIYADQAAAEYLNEAE